MIDVNFEFWFYALHFALCALIVVETEVLHELRKLEVTSY